MAFAWDCSWSDGRLTFSGTALRFALRSVGAHAFSILAGARSERKAEDSFAGGTQRRENEILPREMFHLPHLIADAHESSWATKLYPKKSQLFSLIALFIGPFEISFGIANQHAAVSNGRCSAWAAVDLVTSCVWIAKPDLQCFFSPTWVHKQLAFRRGFRRSGERWLSAITPSP
jgi:hypothetical protein